MLWDEEEKKVDFVLPDNVVDLSFKISCKQLPTTHAWELSQALYQLMPWLSDEPEVGIHQIHGATTGNGWERPPDGELIHLSKRTRMNLRVPRTRVEDALSIVGKKVTVADHELEIGICTEKPLNPLATLFSRYVVVPEGMEEDDFMQWVVDGLAERDIKLRKMLCGIKHTLHTPEKSFETRSLMMADLDKQTSIDLQEQGIGDHRHLGCGIFLPHKGISAVGEAEEKTHFSGT